MLIYSAHTNKYDGPKRSITDLLYPISRKFREALQEKLLDLSTGSRMIEFTNNSNRLRHYCMSLLEALLEHNENGAFIAMNKVREELQELGPGLLRHLFPLCIQKK